MYEQHASGSRLNKNKKSFIQGLVTGIAVIVILGGVFMVGKNFSSGSGSGGRLAGNSGTSGAAPTGQVPPPPQPGAPGDIQIAAVTDDDWVKGDRDAKISLIEFSDLECPFCKRFHPTAQRLVDEYPNDVNWVYRHFPLSSLHQKAQREAEATECAGELGGNDGFWAFTDRLFEITPSNDGLQDSQLPQIAEDVGLSRTAFLECLDSGKYAQKVLDHYNQATAAGGRGTPYSVILTADGEPIPVSGAVPYEQFKSIIDSLI